MTSPALAAWIGVPAGAAMSMPVCIRPQRGPKPDVSTPCTGQMNPLGETPEPPVGSRLSALPAAARARRAASRAAWRWRIRSSSWLCSAARASASEVSSVMR